jgi:hypothetical protein
LAAAPAAVTEPAAGAGPPVTTGCTGKTYTFVVFGGTPPYNATSTSGTTMPQSIAAAGGTTAISGLLAGSGSTSVVFLDSSVPQKSFTSTITCS